MGTSVPVLSGAPGAPPPPATPPNGWDSPSSERWFSPTPLTQVFLHPRDRPPTFQVFPGLETALGATGICSCYWLPDDVIAAQ